MPFGAAVRDAEDFVQRLAIGEFHGREVELAAHDEVDGLAFLQRGFSAAW